jgi:site-specific DNA-methyltransferase (adenine-specific)
MSKPGITVITMARKPLSEGSVAGNVLKWECGGLNIGAARLASTGDHKRPFQPTNNDREVYGAQAGFQPTNADGRWPSNIVLGHLSGCRVDGVKRVTGTGGVPQTQTYNQKTSLRLGLGPRTKYPYYANPETGKEAIPNWICAPGCPVADLDAQSGSSKSRKGKPRKGAKYFKQVAADE